MLAAAGKVKRACIAADVGFAEMTDHKIISADGTVHRSTFAGGSEVEVDKSAGRYTVSDGKARTKGRHKL